MKKVLIGGLLLGLSAHAHAEVGGYIQGGYSNATLEVEDNEGSNIDFDDGGGFNISGGLFIDPGILVRASFDTTSHESGDACISGLGCGSFDDVDVDVDETRFGVFWAPKTKDVVGFRVGGGFEKVELTIEGDSEDADGGFVEAGLLLNAGQVVTFDLGAAAFFLTDDDDDDITGSEFRASAFFHAGPVDIGVGLRGLALTAEDDSSSLETDYTYTAYMLTIGHVWGAMK